MRSPRAPARGAGSDGGGSNDQLGSEIAASIPSPGRPSQAPRPRYSGFLRRSDDGQGIVGVLYDFCGWSIELTGTPGERDGRRGYIVTGELGEPPPALRIPGLDDSADGGRGDG
jgi:hypothetical protein